MKEILEERIGPLFVSSPEQLASMKNSHAIRWYVLTLPLCHRGPAVGLQRELERRLRNGEPAFEFFAPSYREVRHEGDRLIDTHRSLFYNYVFIRSSENELYRMKQVLPQYNFLPRVKNGQYSYYPYLSDKEMLNLQWVARAYSNELPVYVPETKRLMKGDKVRITAGRFKGVEACVAIQPGAGQKDLVVCVENWLWVPLLHVRSGEYEVIALNNEGKHLYSRLDNERLQSGLHEALRRYHSPEGVTDEDRTLASETLRLYGNLQMDSDVMRCKLYALLLPAYAILGQTEAYEHLCGTVRSILPLVKAEQSRALLLVTLYGCTDNRFYYAQAHELIDPWRGDTAALRKTKKRLLQRLDDYDRWLGHCPDSGAALASGS